MAKLNKETASRMGYEDAIAAESFDFDGLRVDVCLVGPGSVLGPRYHLVMQSDCDPDRPTQGSSEVDACGTELEAALVAYEAMIEELITPISSFSP